MKGQAIQWAVAGGAALIASAAARALPEPQPMGSRLYLFMYRFVHYVLANFDKAAPPKI